jgi:hypothetical protein
MKKRGVIDVLVENVGKEQFGARPNAGEPGFESIETEKNDRDSIKLDSSVFFSPRSKQLTFTLFFYTVYWNF